MPQRSQVWKSEERTHRDLYGFGHDILFTVWKIIVPLSSLALVTYLGRCTQNGVRSPILCSIELYSKRRGVRTLYARSGQGEGSEGGERRRLLQVPDVVIRFSAYNTKARVGKGNRLYSLYFPLAIFASMKETAMFEGRSERWEWKWSGEKIAGVIVSAIG